MEKWKECFEQAEKSFKTADHMAYVTFSLLKENRLMIKIIDLLGVAVQNLIKSFLYYEYAFKRIPLYKNAQMNLKTFREKVAPKYLKKEVFENIIRVLEINRKHQQAPVEFVKKEKFVILLGDEYETLDIQRVREFLGAVREGISCFPEQ